MKARKGSLLALTSVLMAATCASSASAWENPLENPYLDEALEVCDQGSFFVGGVPKVRKRMAVARDSYLHTVPGFVASRRIGHGKQPVNSVSS